MLKQIIENDIIVWLYIYRNIVQMNKSITVFPQYTWTNEQIDYSVSTIYLN